MASRNLPQSHVDDATRRRRRYLASAFGVREAEADAVRPVLASHEVSDEQIRGWLTQPQFRRRLRALRRELAARRELEVSRGAHRAARQLSAAAVRILDDFTDLQRKVCVDLIKLSRAQARPARPPADPREPLVSPDLPADEAARIIEAMKDE